MALSPAQLEEYRALLAEVNRLAQGDLVALWRSLEGRDPEVLWEALRAGVPEIVSLYRATAAETAMLFYEETQGLSFSTEEAAVAALVNRRQLESNLRWAVFNPGNTEPLGLVSGIVQKHVVDGSRQYALSGFSSAGTGWYRAARPGACNFCRMLATRATTQWGPYGSADAAVTVGMGRTSMPQVMQKGDTFHQNCMCIPVKASEYQVPDYVDKWTADYYAATSEVGNAFATKDILAAMREISGHAH